MKNEDSVIEDQIIYGTFPESGMLHAKRPFSPCTSSSTPTHTHTIKHSVIRYEIP